MSYKLDVSNSDIKTKVLDVLSNSPTDWVHIGYDGGSTSKLKIVSSGSDGFSELLDELNEGKVQYFYVRFSQGANLYKYVYISYVGEGASGMLRGNSHNHTVELANFLKSIRAPIHVQINARSEADLDEEKIKKQCVGAMGANYDAGAKKQGVSEGVKTVGEGVNIHKTAAEDSTKFEKRNLPFIPDSDSRQQFWNQHQQAALNKGPAPKTIINEDEKKKYWDQQRQQEPKSPTGGPKTIINEDERKKYWDQQKQEEEQKSQQARNVPAPVSASASSLAKQFDAQAQAQVETKPVPQSTGKKWTPQPAVSKPPPAAHPPVIPSKPPPAQPPSVPPSQPPSLPPSQPPSHPPSQPPSLPAPFHPPPVQPPPADDNPADDDWADEEPSHPPSHPPSFPPAAPPSGPPPGPPPSGPPSAPPPGPPPSGPPVVPPKPQLPPPSAEPEIPYVLAVYSFEKEQETDLSFNEGDKIWVLDRSDPSGWWKGRDEYGNEGFFPMNYVQEPN